MDFFLKQILTGKTYNNNYSGPPQQWVRTRIRETLFIIMVQFINQVLVYFSGDWDVHWGLQDFDPLPCGYGSKARIFGYLCLTHSHRRDERAEKDLARSTRKSIDNHNEGERRTDKGPIRPTKR